MAELEATRAVWRLAVRPSVGYALSLFDLPLAGRRARSSAALPPKVPPPPGSPVSEKAATGEAAADAASPPPGASREGAWAEGRRDAERGGGRDAMHPGIVADPRSPGLRGRIPSRRGLPLCWFPG